MKKDELEKVKKEYSKYMKIIKTIIIILLIIATILLGRTIYKFCILNKIVDKNVCMDLGDNYKITTYNELDNSIFLTQYYKNNMKRSTSKDGEENYISNDTMYLIVPRDMEYSIIKSEGINLMYNKKESLLFGTVYEDENFQKKSSLKNGMKYKLSSEEYNNENYMTLELGRYKYYIDKEDFIIKYKKDGNEFYRYEIEKNIVTDEEVAIPNLSGYTKMEGRE